MWIGLTRRLATPLLLAAATVTAACAGPGERVEIPTTQGYDFADFAATPPADVPLTARLVLPESGAVRGAAILSHGAGGTGGRQDRAAVLLAQNGVAALVLDHFSARGIRSVARDQIRLTEQQMAADIFAARDLLAERLSLDPSQIGAIGWSKGATAVTLAAVERFADFLAPERPPLAFAAAFYPFCGFRLDDEALATPLLLLLAGQDDWTPSAPCVRQAQAWRQAAQPIDWALYEDASHGFDSRSGRFTVSRAITVRDTGPRCTLAVDATGRTVSLDRALALDTVAARTDYLAACGERGVTFAGDDAAGAAAAERLLGFVAQRLP
ncbi:MAG: dienelactone hydrolase family protein [Pseudomonadota bacterium]